MILQCPQCETKFLVDSALIPRAGRTVKCANCAHQWFVEPEPEDYPAPVVHSDEPQLTSSRPEEDDRFERAFGGSGGGTVHGNSDYEIPFSPHVPSLPDTKGGSQLILLLATAMLIVMLCISAIFTFRHSLQAPLQGLYNIFGMHSTQGLVLADVSFRERPTRTRARYVVEGLILNQSDDDRRVPLLRVAIADKDGEWIAMREYEAETTILKPGESYPFKAANLETAFIDRVDHLVVDIGSGVELMLRK